MKILPKKLKLINLSKLNILSILHITPLLYITPIILKDRYTRFKKTSHNTQNT